MDHRAATRRKKSSSTTQFVFKKERQRLLLPGSPSSSATSTPSPPLRSTSPSTVVFAVTPTSQTLMRKHAVSVSKMSETATGEEGPSVNGGEQPQEKVRSLRKNKLFRRIEADIRERDRKRKPGRPEEYIDRDRVIAVNLGDFDIRDTMMKQKLFLNKSSMVYEEEQLFKTLVQQAEFELHRNAFDRANGYLNKAIQMVPDDPESLVLRGSCLVGLQRYEEALIDVDQVLEIAPCSRAYLTKGDALYHLGEFEHALVCYYRALRRKRWQLKETPFQIHGHSTQSGGCSTKEEELVRIGIGRSTEAIDNALGCKAVDHFDDLKGFVHKVPAAIFGMSWRDLHQLGTSTKDLFANIKHDSRGGGGSGKRRSGEAKRYQRDLLGQLTKDLDYLEHLASAADFDDSADIKKEAKEGIDFLKHRQEFWSQFNPMYSDSSSGGKK